MEENQRRQSFADTACSYAGSSEADGSHRQIIELYNSIRPLPAGYRLSDSDPWCAAFVSAVAKKCGLLDIVFAECSCDRMIALYQKAGRWQEKDGYRPQTGDLIFYDWDDDGSGDNSGSADHVGIVVSLTGPILRVVEGNLSDRVGFRNILADSRYIRGYGLPDYGGSGPAPREPAKGSSGTGITVPVLRQGDRGSAVRSLQLLLQGAGHGLGPDGADGDFGTNTARALLGYQKKKKLEADAVAGKVTWTALINEGGN